MNRVQELIYYCIGLNLLAFYPLVYAEEMDPTNLSIEQLMSSTVSTATRTEQAYSDTSAAVYVITQEDIERSGVTNIPDTLRMVPGVQVAKINPSEWAITARGFNGRFANKLLVLLDGRTVYSPSFAGVRWENLDMVLEDIERIEVIRGPGASVWGHNAVNGVINIISKHSADTQQGMVSVATGNEERAIVELRYGDQVGEKTHYRVFGKFTRRDQSVDLQGNNADDDWMQGRGGFRVDWNSQKGDRLMFEGDGYFGEFNDNFLLPLDSQQNQPNRQNREQNSGASLLLHWDHDISVASTTHSQLYYEYFNQQDDQFGDEIRHTLDFDFQHDIALTQNNDFNWGFGYRYVSSSLFDSALLTADPNHQNLHLVSAFIQDKAAFFDNKVILTLGTKVQYYTLSGWDYQPTVRLLWKFLPEHRMWAAFSRATRSPSRGETALSINPQEIPERASPIPGSFDFSGNPALEQEHVLSYELGYRGWIGNRLSFDLAVFYNDYDNLVTGKTALTTTNPLLVSYTFENGASAQTWGFEIATDWHPLDTLRFQLSYSFLKVKYHNFNFSDEEKPNNDPQNQVSFRGSYDITPTIAFDTWVRYVDSITSVSTFDSLQHDIDSYVGLDLRLAWKPLHNLELSLVGQNINNSTHLEYIEEVFAYPRVVERSIYGKVKWYFK